MKRRRLVQPFAIGSHRAAVLPRQAWYLHGAKGSHVADFGRPGAFVG